VKNIVLYNAILNQQPLSAIFKKPSIAFVTLFSQTLKYIDADPI